MTLTHPEVARNANDTSRPLAHDACLYTLFAAQAERSPDAPAVLSDGGTVHYGELGSRAEGVAAALAKAGVEPGDRVGVYGAPSADVVSALLGVLRAGAVYVPLEPDWPAERLRFMADDCELRVVACAAEHADAVADLGLTAVTVPVQDPGAPPPLPARDPGDAAYVLYTSGSTGTPKGVVVPHRGVNRLITGAPDYVQLGPECRFLWLSPLTFDASVIELWGPLLSGGAIVVMPPGPDWLDRLGEVIRRHEATAALFISPQLHLIVDRDPEIVQPLDHLLVGGDVLSADHVRRLLASGAVDAVVHCYGPTESTLFATIDVLREVDPGDASLPIGKPIENTTCHVVDDDLRPLPVGVAGELLIGGLGIALGYVNRPELTAEKFVTDSLSDPGAGERLYRTGDLASWRPDGRLEFLGRIDHQVKIRGYRIELGEIEAALRGHEAIEDCVVLAREDDPGRKRLVAYVVASRDLGVPELREFVAQRLPDYMVPAAWVMLAALPLTSNRKVDRAALPAPEPERSNGAGGDPGSALERRISELFAEVLRIDRVGVDDGFFELGGDSLLATEVVGRVGSQSGVALPLDVLADAPTPAQLAQAVERRRGMAPAPAFPALVPQPPAAIAPLSLGQEQICFLSELDPSALAYQFQAIIRLDGDLDVPALESALSGIVARHEIYRTTFRAIDGDWMAEVHEPWRADLPVEDLSATDDPEAALDRLAGDHFGQRIAIDRLPLVRWRLVAVGPGRHALLHAEHHLVHDGWSMMVFLRELRDLYAAAVDGGADPLPPLGIRYSDFAAWQRTLMTTEIADAQLGYWKERLAAPPPPLELPYDAPRPARQTFRGDQVLLTLSPELATGLREMAREQGATLFMAMFAAFATLLHRYSGAADIIVGSGLANRRLRELEALLGTFVNTVALRVDLGGDPTVAELLARVRAAVLEGHAHQDVPFPRVVDAVAPERTASHSPLYQTLFSFADAPLPDLRAPGLEIVPDESPGNGSAKAEINVVVVSHEDSTDPTAGSDITVIWEYNRDLFSAATAERMVAHYRRLLEALVAGPASAISALDLVPDTERRRLLVESNDTAREYPRDASIQACFEDVVERDPGKVAVVAGEERISYDDLNREANRIAGHLKRRGVAPGDRVAVSLDRSPAMLATILGVLKAGAAYVPIDPAEPPDRREFMIRDASTSLCLDGAALADPAIARESDASERGATGPGDDAYVMYTSGSTGEPKGVAVTHRNVVRLVRGQSYAGFGPEEVFLQMAPLAFDASTFEIWGALLNGATLVLYPAGPIDLGELGTVLEDHGVTTLWLTAALFHQVIDTAPGSLRGLRQLLAGGDVLSPAHVSKARRELPGTRLINGYGPTEATTFSCCFEVPPDFSPDGSVPIGRPIANTTAYVLDDRLEPVPIGVPGELCIGGDGVARGYLNRPELTAERFPPDPFGAPGDRLYRTGDVARWRADGRLEFMGRNDLQVKVRGFRVEPGEIEAMLARHPSVREAAVVAPADGSGDRRIVAHVAAAAALDTDELRSFLAERLPPHMVPSAFVEVERLPVTANGKLDREALEHMRESPPPAPASLQEWTGTDTERVIAGIWSELLGVSGVGPEDDFFASGGHSLLGLKLIEAVNEQFGVELQVRSLLVSPTVAGLALEVEGARPAPREPETGGESETETAIAQIWAEVLGLDSVDPEDDFFASGGHSLLALKVIERTRDMFGIELHVRSLLVEPTLAAFAEEVDRIRASTSEPIAPRAPSTHHPAVVPLSPGGDLPPFFLVAGGFGAEAELLVYAKLGHHLDRRLPFYGLRARGVDDLVEPHESVPAMAEEYLAGIREVQPRGPYYIGGSCQGGVVAFELARRLRAKGEEVALLALVDSIFLTPALYARFLGWNLWHNGLQPAIRGATSPREAPQLVRQALRQRLAPSEEQQAGRRRTEVGNRYLRRVRTFRPEPYDRKLTLIACQQRRVEDATRGWREVAPAGIELLYVPGDHFTHLRSHAATTAACLDDCLARAREEQRRAADTPVVR